MSTLVLLLFVAAVTGGSARLGRRRLRFGRAAEAHHRALDTMGRLAARHADDHGWAAEKDSPAPDPAEAQPPSRSAGQAHVRLLPADTNGDRPQPTPPRLRSQPRHRPDGRAASVGSAHPNGDPPEAAARPPVPAPPILSGDRSTDGLSDQSEPSTETERPAEPVVLVFDDSGPLWPTTQGPTTNGAASTGPTAVSVAPSGGRWGRRRGRHQRPRMQINGRSPVVLTVGIVALIGVSVAIGILVGRSGHHAPTPGLSERTGRTGHPAAAAPTRTGTPETSIAAAAPSSPAPAPAAALVATSSDFALYRLGPSGAVTIAASRPCWIEVRVGDSTGALTFEGTLTAGGTHTMTGAAWVRIGDPSAATITVDGSVLDPPGFESGEPYDVQFE